MTTPEKSPPIVIVISVLGMLFILVVVIWKTHAAREFTVCDTGCDMTPAYFDALLGQHSPGDSMTITRKCAVNEDTDGIVCGQAKYQFNGEKP